MNNSERKILCQVREAIFANPFDAERLVIDLAITGLSPAEPTEKILSHLLTTVTETTDAITQRGTGIDGQRSEQDKELLRFGILFRLFHEYCDAYDDHIDRQIQAGEDCCPVPFAREVLAVITGIGIPEPEAIRLFSLFYQMRRAFYFISKIAGRSQCVMDLRSALWSNIFTDDIRIYEQFLWNRMEDFSTLLLGETGTGKGLAASAIGRSGYIPFDPAKNRFTESFTRAFISINLSQYPEQLIESELFGHKKGAFTGAVETHQGVFSRCSQYGAIFLDEIGDVSVPVQIKLLQVLQERTFTAVGSHKSEKFQGRVIAATNKSIEDLRQTGQFRDDFYYRLCSDVIHVPPLRTRLAENPGELAELLHFTVSRILGVESPQVMARVKQRLQDNQPPDYPWPGNIRELEQCVRRLLLNNSYQWQIPSPPGAADTLAEQIDKGELTAGQLLSEYCTRLYRCLGTYEAVAKQTQLDRRTVKKYIQSNS